MSADDREAAIRRIGIRRRTGDVPALADALADPAPQVRSMACRALGWQRSVELAALLAGRFDDADPTVRQQAVRALAVCVGPPGTDQPALPEAVVEALVALLGDPDGAVREAAARTCGWVSARPAIPTLEALLEEDAHGPARAESAHALGRLRAAYAAEALLRALGDPDGGVRRHAARALGMLDVDAALPRLRTCLDDPDPEVRVAALRSVTGMSAGAEHLVRALGDDDPGVRSTAAILIGRRPSAVVPTTTLTVAHAGEEHPEVRENLARTLRRRGALPAEPASDPER